MCVRRDAAAVDRLEAGRTCDDDVLSELDAELDPLGLELCLRADPARVHGVQHLLRERLELVVLRYGLGLAPDRDHRSLRVVLGEPVSDEPFRRLAPGTLLRLRHALFAEQGDRRVHVAVRLLERALAVHHPGAGAVSELLDERCRDLSHWPGPPPARRLPRWRARLPRPPTARLPLPGRARWPPLPGRPPGPPRLETHPRPARPRPRRRGPVPVRRRSPASRSRGRRPS